MAFDGMGQNTNQVPGSHDYNIIYFYCTQHILGDELDNGDAGNPSPCWTAEDRSPSHEGHEGHEGHGECDGNKASVRA